MAREAYRSVYGDLTKLKDDSVLKDPAAGPDDDDELFELLLAVSDWVDGYCNRHFYPRVEALLFDGTGGDRLVVPDLIAVSELAQPDGGGDTFGKAWDAGQFRLLPHNASPLRPWGHPYGAVRARAERGEGFTSGEANFRLTGVWGYRLFAEASGATLTAEAAAEDIGITVSEGAQFRVGQTLLLGGGGDATASEQVLVTGVDGNGAVGVAGAEWLVRRDACQRRWRGHPEVAGVGGAGGADTGGAHLDAGGGLRAVLR